MGMSASQMRYCMLTGRKSDIEYQGQQINQQRTTLATQSSVMNEQLLTLAVPTPPSTDDYVRTVYKFNNGGQECMLTGKVVYDSATGTWDVGYARTDSIEKGEKFGQFRFDKNVIPEEKDASGNVTKPAQTQYLTKEGTLMHKVVTDPTADGYDFAQASDVEMIRKDCNKPSEDFYVYNTSSGYRYVAEGDLEDKAGTSDGISTYVINQNAQKTESATMKGCQVEYNEKNRITRIIDSECTVYQMSIETQHDEDAYKDAYNQYEFDKYEYEQKMNEINAKLELIQSQDKQLELKLSNLDTEQSAVSTEMDAVKKVLDKNVESTFKTFG